MTDRIVSRLRRRSKVGRPFGAPPAGHPTGCPAGLRQRTIVPLLLIRDLIELENACTSL